MPAADWRAARGCVPQTAFIALHNDAEEPRTVRTGERIAQLVLLPYLPIEFDEVTDLPETARGEGGFGSTGR